MALADALIYPSRGSGPIDLPGPDCIAMRHHTSWRLPLATALALAFGVMLVLALGSVLAVNAAANLANTRTLLAQRSNLLLDMLSDQLTAFVGPVERQLVHLAASLGNGDIGLDDLHGGRAVIHSVMTATPQLAGFALLRPDLSVQPFQRGKGALPRETWSAADMAPELLQAALTQEGLHWITPVWSPDRQQFVMNVAVPVRRQGELAGVLIGAVALDAFVDRIRRLSDNIGQPVFILRGRDHVLASSRLKLGNGDAGGLRPLPGLAEAGDPVLAAIWENRDGDLGFLRGLLRGRTHKVSADGVGYAFFYREFGNSGAEPWIVGSYLPLREAGLEIRRLMLSILLSLGCIVLAVAATFLIGRRMARPVKRLAEAARRIQLLDLHSFEPLPRSHIRELDRAASAFNAMGSALAWFETYLPRRLVRQLMRNPSAASLASRQLQVTVMFTDIVGFSSLAEDLDATETAALLNAHFELLARCIAATEGTIDKYLGDGLMAFWGAPVEQPDHAERAVQAALRIRDELARADQPGGLRLRIGIHSGPALVGNIGAQERLNYTLIGDTVNVAQRLEQLGKEVAADGEVVILAGAATATRAGELCAVQPLGARHLRGRDETVEVFRLH